MGNNESTSRLTVRIRPFLVGEGLADKIIITTAVLTYALFRVVMRLVFGKAERDLMLMKKFIHVRNFMLSDATIKVNGCRFYCRRRYEDYSHILTHENWLLELAKNLLKSGDIFIDVGCHVGKYSIFLANYVGPEGKVFAIDANPENIRAIKKNAELNEFANIAIINTAVADTDGERNFYLSRWSGQGSLIQSDARKESVVMTTATLDTLLWSIDKIDLIKMDIEGTELEAIKGAKLTLKKTRKLIIECHNEGNRKKLEKILDEQFSVQILNTDPDGSSRILCEKI